MVHTHGLSNYRERLAISYIFLDEGLVVANLKIPIYLAAITFIVVF